MEYTDTALKVLTLDQWKALGFLLLIVAAVAETYKRVFLAGMSPTKKRRHIYAVSFVTGVGAGGAGWVMAGTDNVPDYYWLTFGVLAGPAANFIHWVLLGVVAWKWPDLADNLPGKRR